MIRFLLTSPDAGFERRMRLAFGGALNGDLQRLPDETVALHPAQALQHAGEQAVPEVVLVGPGLDQEVALEVARRFDAERPEISVVLVAPPRPEVLEAAIRAGVRDVLDPDASDAEIRAVVERASQTAVRRRVNLVPDTDAPGQAGHVLTVVSPKGGSGKTTVATNLAVGLAEAAPEQVVIVDLDLQFGDVASGLQLVAEHSMTDAVAALATLDSMALKVYLERHGSGLFALCAPEHPADGDRLTAEQVSQVVRLLASEFRYVVVDTPAGLTEHTLAALEASTDVVLVASMDVPSVRSLRKEIEVLDALGMTTLRRHVVLNRADSRVGLQTPDVEATLGLPVDAALPSSRAVALSVNQGVPLVHADPRSPVARALTTLAQRFVPQKAQRSGGFLSFMKAAR